MYSVYWKLLQTSQVNIQLHLSMVICIDHSSALAKQEGLAWCSWIKHLIRNRSVNCFIESETVLSLFSTG